MMSHFVLTLYILSIIASQIVHTAPPLGFLPNIIIVYSNDFTMNSLHGLIALVTIVSAQQLYDVELYSMSSEPVISFVNPIGKGHSPCNYTFNPAYVPASDTVMSIYPQKDICNN